MAKGGGVGKCSCGRSFDNKSYYFECLKQSSLNIALLYFELSPEGEPFHLPLYLRSLLLVPALDLPPGAIPVKLTLLKSLEAYRQTAS